MLDLKLNKESKTIIKGLIAFMLYFLFNYYVDIPFRIFNVDYTNVSMTIKQIYLIAYQVLSLAIIIFIYRNDITKDFKDFKLNYKKYFNENIKYWLFALAIMYASNFIIAILKYRMTGDLSTAANEEAIRSTLAQAPIYTFIAASFIAPIMEELVFRKSLRCIFKHNLLFIVISAFIFGGLHVFTGNLAAVDYLYLIPYCAPGIAFAIILVKTDNILNTISLHFIHNTLLMILQVIMLVRGII